MLINNKIIFFNPFLFVVEGHIYNAPTTTGEIFMKNINLHKNINLITIKIDKNECNYFFSHSVWEKQNEISSEINCI